MQDSEHPHLLLDTLATHYPDAPSLLPSFFGTVGRISLTKSDLGPEATMRNLTGWEPIDGREVREALRADLAQGQYSAPVHPEEVDHLREALRHRESVDRVNWSGLFLQSDFVGSGWSGNAGVEVWATSTVGPSRPVLRSAAAILLFTLQSIAEEHSGVGWHIHPVDGRGGHYGYRMLFDRRRTQDELAWEAHGRGDLRWKDPSAAVLPANTATEIYRSSLDACRVQSRLRHLKFREWAAMFAAPSNKTYLAVDRTSGPPAVPVRWHDLPYLQQR